MGACLGMGTGPLLSSLSTATARLSHCQTPPGGMDMTKLHGRFKIDIATWVYVFRDIHDMDIYIYI